jgi:hypothetical protein
MENLHMQLKGKFMQIFQPLHYELLLQEQNLEFGYSSVVGWMFTMCKALDLIPSTQQKAGLICY